MYSVDLCQAGILYSICGGSFCARIRFEGVDGYCVAGFPKIRGNSSKIREIIPEKGCRHVVENQKSLFLQPLTGMLNGEPFA